MIRPENVSRRDLLFGLRRTDTRQKAVAQIKEHCLSLHGVSCRTCDDACEVRAIRFRPQIGGRVHPSINVEACTACGACIEVCPVSALSIVGAESHA